MKRITRFLRANAPALVLCLLALPVVLSNCVCLDDGYHKDDDFFDDDATCDCGGLARAIYHECSGAILIDGAELREGIFVQVCFTALEQDTEDADDYYCYIEALCDADDCDDFARQLELCTVQP